MTVQTTPLGLLTLGLGAPVGARIRSGGAKSRWLRARRGRRVRLDVCVVTLVGRHPAMITRATLYGAIIRGKHRLKRREMVALCLPSGWRVKARVQWRFGSRCGISFLTPVADFARILCEGATARSGERRLRTSVVPSRLGVAPLVVLPGTSSSGLAARLAVLAAWAKAHADRLRLWSTAKRGGMDSHVG